ncbi:MAG: ADP-ribosylation factor-like protein [Candidatus Hodarchaeota archaeon]
MSQDQILCISYFDHVIGPNTLYCSAIELNSIEAPDLGRILEFNEEPGTFIFAYRKYQTINHIFYIDSKLARGGKDLMMISYLIRTAIFKDEIVDVFKYLDSKAPILEEFASEIKKLKDISILLHTEKRADENILELANDILKKKFLRIFNEYYKKLAPRFQFEPPLKGKQHIKKIFIIGAPKAGKKTFLKNIELIQFLNIKNNDIPTRILEVLIENLEILHYDDLKKEFKCKFFDNFNDCIYNAQGFIVLTNITDKKSIDTTKKLFNIVKDKCVELRNEMVPVLIVGNKFENKEKYNTEYIFKNFQLKDLEQKGVKVMYQPLNIMIEDDVIMKSLRWLIKSIL